ncbi:MAG: hypothetical protein LBR88_00030 [Zoogloeaceae bacterium]|jgi:thioredoxin-related protein|nr:hypothetical protein [Zoogloeaceae bacterium]
MPRRALRLFCLTLAFAATSPWAAEAASPLFPLAEDSLLAAAQTARVEKKMLVALLELEDCDNCRSLRARVLETPEARRDFGRDFHTVALRLDSDAALTLPDGERVSRRQWANRLDVFGAPAFIFFDSGGKTRYRHLGGIADVAELLALGRYISTAAYEEAPWGAWRAQQIAEESARKAATPPGHSGSH